MESDQATTDFAIENHLLEIQVQAMSYQGSVKPDTGESKKEESKDSSDKAVVPGADVAAEAAEEAAPAMPAFDMKMPLTLGIMYFSRKIDFTTANENESEENENVTLARMALAGAATFCLLLYLFVYTRIGANKKKNDIIYVAPKAAPAMFSPPAGPPDPKEWEEVTYNDHETKLLREAFSQLLMSCGIAVFMSMKFQIHVSCVMQCILLPYSVWDLLVCRKYLGLSALIGGKTEVYGELLERPEGWTGPIAPPPPVEASPEAEPAKSLEAKKNE